MSLPTTNEYELIHTIEQGCACTSCQAMDAIEQPAGQDTGPRLGNLLKADLLSVLSQLPGDPLDFPTGDPGDAGVLKDIDMRALLARLKDAVETPEENAQISGGDPLRDEQQATSSTIPYDVVLDDPDQATDGLISGRVWDQTDLTFSFPDDAGDYESGYYDASAIATITGFNETQKNVTRDAFDMIASISGLTFTEASTDAEVKDADLRLAKSDNPGTAYAYYPSDSTVGGDSFFNTGRYNSPEIGNYQYVTFLHEIGHALGLKHGHETSGAGAIPYEMDSMEFSVMTYRSWVGKPLDYGYANETWGYAQSLMMLDINALQRMYGANFETNAGDTTYTFSTTTGEMFIDGVGVGTPGGNRVFRTVWDGNGEDTYDFSNYTTNLAVDLSPGGYSDFDTDGNFQRAKLDFGYNGNPVTYARGHLFNAMQFEGDERSLIENANGGSGNDSFVGNAADNTFDGGAGDDVFADSAGSDTYIGGAGTDTVFMQYELASYSFSIAGTFLQITEAAIDWISDTIEWITFADVTRSFSELVDSIGGDPQPQPDPNTAPRASDDSFVLTEGDGLGGANLLANDSDPENDSLTVTALNGAAAAVGQVITLASGARVTLNADGSFSYNQNGAFEGLMDGETATDSFVYTVSDGELTDTATVTITIHGVTDNLAPVAFNDNYSETEGAPVSVLDVLANDSDANGDTLQITAINGQTIAPGFTVSLASGARITLNADGTLSYDQNGAFDSLGDGQTGTDVFSYTVSDGSLTDTAQVTMTITGQVDNLAPVANDDTAATDEDVILLGLNVLANDSDPDGAGLTITAIDGRAISAGQSVTLASGAIVTLNADGTLAFDQNGIYDSLGVGETAMASFSYTVSDGAMSATAAVSITINGAFDNTGPVARNDSGSGGETGVITGNVLDNDTDADGATLTVTAVNGAAAGVGSQVQLLSGALLTLNADGSYSYDQNGAFDTLETGQSASESFTYTIADGQGGFDTATVTLTINGSSPAAVTTPVNVSFEDVPEGIYMGQEGLDAAGIETVSQGIMGSRSGLIDGPGTAEFTTGGGEFDLTSAVFRAVSGRVRVTISAYEGDILVSTDSFNAFDRRDIERLFDTGFNSIDKLVIATDGPLLIDNLSFVTRTSADGNGTPIAEGDLFAIGEGSDLVGNLMADNGFGADSDPDGDAISVTAVEGDSSGVVTLSSGATVTFQANGTFIYEQNGAFSNLYDGQTATDSFTYTVADANGAADTGTVQITVNGSGTPPSDPNPTPVTLEFEQGLDSDGFVFAGAEITTADMGTVSGTQAAQSTGNSISFTRDDGANFDFDGGVFTAVAGKNVDVTVEGWLDGQLVSAETFRIRDNKETAHEFAQGFDELDQVRITADGGIIVDDLLLSY